MHLLGIRVLGWLLALFLWTAVTLVVFTDEFSRKDYQRTWIREESYFTKTTSMPLSRPSFQNVSRRSLQESVNHNNQEKRTWRSYSIAVKNIVSTPGSYASTHNPAQHSIQKTIHVQQTASESSFRRKSYLIALGFDEQLSAASHSLLQLAPLAADWNAQLVEPAVTRSRLFGIRGFVPPHFRRYLVNGSINLSELYDLSKLHKVLHTRVSPQLYFTPFKEFIASAARDITLLHFNSESPQDFGLSQYEERVTKFAFLRKHSAYINCSRAKSARDLAREIEDHLNTALMQSPVALWTNENFTLKRIICLNPSLVYNSRSLLDLVYYPGTVIFTSWRGCGAVNCSVYHGRNSGLVKNPHKSRYSVLTYTSLRQSLSVRSLSYLHHPEIFMTALTYLETIDVRHPFLSVHVRVERLLKDRWAMNYNFAYIACCLRSLKLLADKLVERYHFTQTLVITDMSSEYGSDGCNFAANNCNKSDIQKVLSMLAASFNFAVTSYSPKVLGTTENSAYVSLVEMSMLSVGERLVLVGRGGFQAVLKEKFLGMGHLTNEVHHICLSTDDDDCNSLLSTLHVL